MSFVMEKISWLKQKFSKMNMSTWKPGNNKRENNKKLLLYVTRHDITALIDAMLFSKMYCNRNNCELFVGVDAPTDEATRGVYKSFCINGFLDMYITNLLIKIYCLFSALKIWIDIRNPEEILNVSYQNIQLGEELYDTIIRCDTSLYTVEKIDFRVYKAIYGCILRIYIMEHLIKKYDINTFVYVDCDYERNMFFKVAIKHNLSIYQVILGKVYKHNERMDYKEVFFTTISLELYEKYFNTPKNEVKAVIDTHFAGQRIDYLDAVAYQKKKYSKEMLFDACNLKLNNKKNILIAAHAFSDRSHYGRNMIYRDYYQWLLETIKILGKEKNLNVFVKEHPSSHFYREKGSVGSMCYSLGINNVYIIPEDCNTISLFTIMDVIVTCQGTIGIEAVIHGIPIITAGHGYYYGYGIDNNASNKKEYVYMLQHINDLPKVNNSQKETARILLYIYNILLSNRHSSKWGIIEGMTQKEKYTHICKGMDDGNTLNDEYYRTVMDYINLFSDDTYSELKRNQEDIC